jgi:hypothetical protein
MSTLHGDGERPHEGNLAWELVEQARDCLDEEERHVAFVHLGVGDYPPVYRCVLNAVARERMPLAAHTIGRLKAWADAYDMHREFAAVLAQLGDSAVPRLDDPLRDLG